MAVVQLTQQPEQEIQPDFDTFWLLYPRHEAKKDARRAWDRMSAADQLAAVVAVADWRHIWHAQGRDSRTTPMPATWLNGERWEDEIPHGILPRRQQATPAQPFVRGEIPDSVKAVIAKLRRDKA